jgi:hypothetical protein
VGVSSGSIERTFSPSSTGRYFDLTETIQLWQDGAAVRLFGGGGEFPRFDEMLVGPAPLTLLEPDPARVIVDRSQPFSARWSGGAGGMVVVAINGQNANQQSLTVKCSFAPSAGSGSIPPSALAEFSPMWVAAVFVFAEDYRIVRQGPWELRLATRRDEVAYSVTWR